MELSRHKIFFFIELILPPLSEFWEEFKSKFSLLICGLSPFLKVLKSQHRSFIKPRLIQLWVVFIWKVWCWDSFYCPKRITLVHNLAGGPLQFSYLRSDIISVCPVFWWHHNTHHTSCLQIRSAWHLTMAGVPGLSLLSLVIVLAIAALASGQQRRRPKVRSEIISSFSLSVLYFRHRCILSPAGWGPGHLRV